MSSTPDYISALAAFASSARFEDLPTALVAKMQGIVADTLAVMATGMRASEVQSLAGRQLAQAMPGNASVVGLARRANAADAAMLNAVAGVWLDLDEGNTIAHGHPGIQVLPSALALAQESGCAGRDFLTAFAIGYEVGARIGGASRMKLIVNPHGTFGVIGAALATARLTGLPANRYHELINIAGSTAIATNRNTMKNGATVRNWYAGHSAFMGQMAVRLAASGFTGPVDGPGTTFGMVLGDGFDPDAAIADLGTRWLALDGYLKLHPTARYAHSAIDALYDALPTSVESWPRPDDIEHIDIRAYQLAAFLSAKVVKNAFGTRFSIPFALATIIHHRRSGIDCFDDDAIRIAAVQELAQRIDVNEDPAFTAQYPRQQRVDVRLALRDGRFFEGRCTITSGEPANPHPPRSLERKFMSLSAPIWGEAGARALLDECLALEQASEMRAFPQSVTL